MGGRSVRLTRRAVNWSPVVVRPFLVLATKVMGPGPLRLKMVKLAHELDDRQVVREAA
jgi:hypothetical protein